LFRNQGRLYLDLMPVRGVDLGSFALSAHALVRITAGASVTASPLRFQWFDAALSQQMLPSTLGGARSERGSLVLGADHVALQKWLAARPTADPAFGPEATFTRIAGGTRN
jgi:hypothetical protein